jgi:hypothetical protein
VHNSDGKDALGVAAMAREIGVGDIVQLEPRRVPYLDALRTMQNADVLLLLGSTDSHYTASKLFPSWLANRPHSRCISFGQHRESTLARVGRRDACHLRRPGRAESRVKEVAFGVASASSRMEMQLCRRDNESAFEPYSARGIARTYARLFDRVVAGGESGKVESRNELGGKAES